MSDPDAVVVKLKLTTEEFEVITDLLYLAADPTFPPHINRHSAYDLGVKLLGQHMPKWRVGL